MNPTKQFLSDLTSLIMKYEDETGVHLHQIKVERIDVPECNDARASFVQQVRLVMS